MSLDTPKPRNLYLSRAVDASSMNELIKSIIDIESSDVQLEKQYKLNGMLYYPKHINLYIDSPGGACYSGLGLISVMQMCKTPVRSITTGLAASCAFMIGMCADERVAYQHSTFMYHQVSSGAIGKLGDLVIDVEEAKRVQQKFNKLVLSNSKITKSKLQKNFLNKEDWYMDAEQALELGVIDKIITSNFV